MVLLVSSNDLSTAAGAAGFALLGAAVVRFLDGMSKAAEEDEAREAQRRRDLDETRRMIYMALATIDSSIGGSVEAAGTVANVLAHHYRKFSETAIHETASTSAASRIRPKSMTFSICASRRPTQTGVRPLSGSKPSDSPRTG